MQCQRPMSFRDFQWNGLVQDCSIQLHRLLATHMKSHALCSGVRRSGFKLRPHASTGCARTSAQRSGRATSEWLASTNTWDAMIVKQLLPKPLTRQSCCGTSTAGMARPRLLWSPTSLLNTTRQVKLTPTYEPHQSHTTATVQQMLRSACMMAKGCDGASAIPVVCRPVLLVAMFVAIASELIVLLLTQYFASRAGSVLAHSARPMEICRWGATSAAQCGGHYVHCNGRCTASCLRAGPCMAVTLLALRAILASIVGSSAASAWR